MGKVSPAERDAILLDYECAYIAANGSEPYLRLLNNGRYAIGGISRLHEEDAYRRGFVIYEFPRMAKTLWDRAERQNLENRTDSLKSLINRLMPIKLSEVVVANEIQTSARGQ